MNQYDDLARDMYAQGKYEEAVRLGEQALPYAVFTSELIRLKQNLRWYRSALDKKAYVTLLSTDEYINGLVVLNKSLIEHNAEYLLYCLVTPNISKDNLTLLEKLNIPYIKVEQIYKDNYKNKTAVGFDYQQDENNWHHAMAKLHIFELTQFSKIVYIDADIVVTQNIDDLFERPHMSCLVGDRGPREDVLNPNCNTLNAGLMVIEPSQDLYKDIIKFLNSPEFQPNEPIHDQLLLVEYYKDWPKHEELHIPTCYAAPITTFDRGGGSECYLYHMEEIKAIHVLNVKPWMMNRKYFIDTWMNSFPHYTNLCLWYINILNSVIGELQRLGITNKYLKYIN